MSRLVITIALCALSCFCHSALLKAEDVEPVVVRVPEPSAWTGQGLKFFVDLKAEGSFSGAASFSVPAVPGTTILKSGNPTVSSQEIDGESWFVQSHGFVLFSQQDGSLTIPTFEVRFASRQGFTGPVHEQILQVPEFRVLIQRPPNSQELGFLVTTDTLTVNESWDPEPGAAPVGTVFTRTITQRAEKMTGMALAPPPDISVEGIKIYRKPPRVADSDQRGELTGERTDTVTYLFEAPGTYVLPATVYSWWDPSAERLESVTLPSVTFECRARSPAANSSIEDQGRFPLATMAVLIVTAVVLMCYTFRIRLAAWLRLIWLRVYPPRKQAAHKLKRACRGNHAADAYSAWWNWTKHSERKQVVLPQLQEAVVELERCFYGTHEQTVWNGQQLFDAFVRQQEFDSRSDSLSDASPLPPLNPNT